MNSPKNSFVLDLGSIVILCGMVTLPPLALGASAPWARNLLFLTSLILLSAWIIRSGLQGEIRLVRSSAWFFILLFLGLVALQLIPIPPTGIKFLSPKCFEIYQRTIPNYVESNIALPLSVSPYSTITGMTRILILIIAFFVVVHVVSKRWQVLCIATALVGIGLFESFYGFAEHFSGNKHIFWIPRKFHLSAVTGTFHNKNFFSGLLEMVVFVALGLMSGVSTRRGGSKIPDNSQKFWRVRFFQAANSRRLHIQIILGLISVVMFIAIFFSLSRAGILCTIIAFIGFGIFLGLAAGFRRYTLTLLFIVSVLLTISTTIGMELVLKGLENAATGQDPSWLLRVDLAKHAVDYLKDFLVLGSGLGTFALAYPQYQSINIGDKVVDYLHNDWLQFFCETGLLGGLTISLGFLLFYLKMIRAIILRRDPFCKWVATGCLVGSLAILVHSFFDYNLSKITSNGIIFSVVLGLGFACIHMSGEHRSSPSRLKTIRIPLAALPLRLLLFLLALGLFPLWSKIPSTSIKSDIHFNHYLSAKGISNPVHFLPIKDSKKAPLNYLNLALEEDKLNPHILYYSALECLRHADEIVRNTATNRARDIVGGSFETQDPKGFKDVVNALAENIKLELKPKREKFLVEAKHLFLKVIAASPTEPKYQLDLAQILLELEPESSEIPTLTNNARWLAPNKPYIQFRSGKIYVALGLHAAKLSPHNTIPEPGSKKKGSASAFSLNPGNTPASYFDMALKCFRKAILGEPSYTKQVYPIVKSHMGGIEAIYNVTPLSFGPYKKLGQELWKAGEWKKLLTCIKTTETLIGKDTMNFFNPTPDPLRSRMSVVQQKCRVLGMLGCWNERTKAVHEYRQLLSAVKGSEISEARHLKKTGRTSEAISRFKKILKNDWHNTDALLEIADIMARTPNRDFGREEITPLDHLFRAVINCTTLISTTWNKSLEFRKWAGDLNKTRINNGSRENEQDLPSSSPADNVEKQNSKARKNLSPKNVDLSDFMNASQNQKFLTHLQYKKIISIIEKTEMDSPQHFLLADFIRGAAAVLSGKNLDGIVVLERLVSQTKQRPSLVDQGHLIWFFLGYAYERVGDGAKAITAYREVIQRIPNHFPSLIRLVENGYAPGLPHILGSNPATNTDISSLRRNEKKL